MSNTTTISWSDNQAVIGSLEATVIKSQTALNQNLSERICKYWYVEDEEGPLTLGSASLGIFTNLAFVAVYLIIEEREWVKDVTVRVVSRQNNNFNICIGNNGSFASNDFSKTCTDEEGAVFLGILLL